MNYDQAEEANQAEINRLELLIELNPDFKSSFEEDIKKIRTDPAMYWDSIDDVKNSPALRRDTVLRMREYYR